MSATRYVRASEIGTFVFCHRAWHLSRIGAPSALEPERAAGTAYHDRVGAASVRRRRLATGFLVLAVALLIIAAWLALR